MIILDIVWYCGRCGKCYKVQGSDTVFENRTGTCIPCLFKKAKKIITRK